MNTTQQLLDRAKAQIGAESDYRLAKTLHWNPATVSSYRTGRSQIDSNGLFVLAELLGMSHGETLATWAAIEAERAKDDQTRATWQARLKRLGGIAATVTAAALFLGAQMPTSDAPQQITQRNYRLLLLSEVRGFRRRRVLGNCQALFCTFFSSLVRRRIAAAAA